MFENSLSIIKEAGLIYCHIFPYSKREGTPAALIPAQVPKSIAKERAALLRAAGKKQFIAHCETRLGQMEKVLVEKNGLGRSEQFVPVSVESGKTGEIITVRVFACSEKGLLGELVRSAA